MRDRDLVRLYWPARLRGAFDALMDIDEALAEVVSSSTQPALGAIRLAWWREALERLDQASPPAEPRLTAVAELVLPLGVSGREVAGIEDGYAALLEEKVDLDRVEASGARLFAIGAKLLGADDAKLDAAGRLFAQGRNRRRGLKDDDGIVAGLSGHAFPTKLRPLTGLARLAARDMSCGELEPEATPGRAAALIAHRLTGKVA